MPNYHYIHQHLNWVNVPDRELWENGTLTQNDVKEKIWRKIQSGHYKIQRRKCQVVDRNRTMGDKHD